MQCVPAINTVRVHGDTCGANEWLHAAQAVTVVEGDNANIN